MIVVRYAVEGATDAPVVERLIRLAGATPQLGLVARGKSRLDPRIQGIQAASTRFGPWVVVRDLDHDAASAVELARSLAPVRADFAEIRIAVRQVEAWLLADAAGFSRHFAVAASRIPAAPDSCDDAKRAVVDACGASKRRTVRDDMLPRPRSGRPVGPGYEGSLIEFATTSWDPERAATRSDSLARAITRVAELVKRCKLG